ncbi:MAG: uroporphyrinogen decarboxylase [Clostridiales bacterium]|jgi:uroporphyrinogen decarboxylase|nr:uroporphyrinogen decarboxylase [Clostridiales bacterium]
MTRRERVIAALNHKDTGIVPYQMYFTGAAREKFERELGKDFARNWGFFLHGYQYGYETSIGGGLNKDEAGVIRRTTGETSRVVNTLIPDIEDYGYKFPEIDEKRLRQDIESHLNGKEDMFTFVGGAPLYERACSLCGAEEVLMAMAAAPDALLRLMSDIYEYNVKVMDIMLSYGFDAFYIGDDWASQRGLIMGKEHWRTFIKPFLKKLYQKAKDKGRYVIQHSCGGNADIFPDLIEIGMDCYQTFQPECYDVEYIKKEYGNKMTIWGGISAQGLLVSGTEEEVRAESRKMLKLLSEGGGYILSPTHTVPHDVPTENLLALYEVMSNQDQ